MKTEEMVILIGVVGTLVLIMILVMWFVSTNNRRILRSFREAVRTNGTIVDIWIKRDNHSQGLYYEPYVISYSYYDGGSMREGSFESLNKKQVHKLKVNDRITVYYDRQEPNHAVTAMQMEWEKSMWWRILLAFAVILLPAVLIVCYTM